MSSSALPPLLPSTPPSVPLPRRLILSPPDLLSFQKSNAYKSLLSYVASITSALSSSTAAQAAMRGTVKGSSTGVTERLVEVMEMLHDWARAVPASSKRARFGDPQFRVFSSYVSSHGPSLLSYVQTSLPSLPSSPISPPSPPSTSVHNLLPHLASCFGHPTRLDYGTGHELSYLILLFSLRLPPLDVPEAFEAYLGVTRCLQEKFYLEPAGSHGVWGLDDYHLLPFLFGSSSLSSPASGSAPKDALDPSWSPLPTNLYSTSLRHTLALKSSAPFHVVSPTLHSLTSIPTWSKVAAGLMRMWKAEVLDKFVV
eukprot:CAMPEP_0182483342 /NCGR_PEP_ID=MMETSP1319-20130603/41134_1 /TAXON_ID=172717 /ORGANISM="Bolidomonas pacifica, Strain RCC208" /LENGTH=311 /DNA_ID=CAMNT_0024685141 /DNA_START=20 /DNA_END=952 /DNA_ORIENTATION=+